MRARTGSPTKLAIMYFDPRLALGSLGEDNLKPVDNSDCMPMFSHGGYSSGCIETTKQPSTMEKNEIILHYAMQNDCPHDLILPSLLQTPNHSCT